MNILFIVMFVICMWVGIGAESVTAAVEMVMVFVIFAGSLWIMDDTDSMPKLTLGIVMMLVAAVLLILVLFSLPGAVFEFVAGALLVMLVITLVATPLIMWSGM